MAAEPRFDLPGTQSHGRTGLLTAEGLNGKKVFSLTAGGREAREAAFDVDGADPDQVERAAALLENVRREPYAILADGPTRDEHAEVTGT